MLRGGVAVALRKIGVEIEPLLTDSDRENYASHLDRLYLAMQQIQDRRTLDHRRRDGACSRIWLRRNLNHTKRNFAVRRFLCVTEASYYGIYLVFFRSRPCS